MHKQYRNHPLPILESQLDWLTITVRPGKKQQIMQNRVMAWISDQEALGWVRKPFRTPFYEGVRIQGIAWGKREDDCLLSLSSDMARDHAPLALSWGDNVSRLDAQITVQEPDLSSDWAGYVDRLAGLHPSVQSGETETRIIRQRPAGVTAYIGSPSSDRMLRCYDKHAESDGNYPPGSWRFEVQWRHKRAAHVANKLLDGRITPQACLEAVCQAYSAYGIDVPVLCIPASWADAAIPHRTDITRQLLWLRRSIAPCVERLIDAVGMETVLTALGQQAIFDTLEGQRLELAIGEVTATLDQLRSSDNANTISAEG